MNALPAKRIRLEFYVNADTTHPVLHTQANLRKAASGVFEAINDLCYAANAKSVADIAGKFTVVAKTELDAIRTMASEAINSNIAAMNEASTMRAAVRDLKKAFSKRDTNPEAVRAAFAKLKQF